MLKKGFKLSALIIMICFIFVAGCSTKKVEIKSIIDLENRNVGIYTGSEYDKILTKTIKNAKSMYYNSYSDEISALKSGKVDGFLTDEPLAKDITLNNSNLKILDEKLTNDSYAFAITPNKKELKEEIDKVIIEMKNNGTLKKFENKWMGNDDSKKILNHYDNKPKTIKFATVSGSAPFAYMKNNRIVGYDIDIINYIGNKLNYNVEVIEMSFEGIIPALKSGKVDVAGCSIIVTEERKKSVLFSEPNYTGGIVVVVRDDKK